MRGRIDRSRQESTGVEFARAERGARGQRLRGGTESALGLKSVVVDFGGAGTGDPLAEVIHCRGVVARHRLLAWLMGPGILRGDSPL